MMPRQPPGSAEQRQPPARCGPGTDWREKPDAPPSFAHPRAAASAGQAPGQGPWPGKPASGSYSFRRTMRLETMGGSLR